MSFSVTDPEHCQPRRQWSILELLVLDLVPGRRASSSSLQTEISCQAFPLVERVTKKTATPGIYPPRTLLLTLPGRTDADPICSHPARRLASPMKKSWPTTISLKWAPEDRFHSDKVTCTRRATRASAKTGKRSMSLFATMDDSHITPVCT